MPGNPGAFSLLGNPVGDGAGHKAVRFDAAVIAAGSDPANQLGNQFSGLSVSAVARIHVDGDRAVEIHLFVFLVILHDFDQGLGNLQAVVGLSVELGPDIPDQGAARDLVKEHAAVALTDHSNDRHDFCVVKVLGIRAHDDVDRRVKFCVIQVKSQDFVGNLLDVQLPVSRALEHLVPPS